MSKKESKGRPATEKDPLTGPPALMSDRAVLSEGERRTVSRWVVWDETFETAFRGRLYQRPGLAEEALSDIVWHSRHRYSVREVHVLPKPITFDELVEYGRKQGVPLHDGFPWSFDYAGYPVSHENNDLYLITTHTETLRFNRGQTLAIDGGEIRVR